ncbi:P450 family sporulation-specific N-formyltyrosine oxidase Dit2 [Delitschia confertaspora ATCC 74209]|uniref:P450 family sporulation-specific N-formyltyrosine oxidase Dit2 n=1 Tax=Delitschia confertaspora ATCC 74209 TaxID=1513339 RepID=A0A9P4MSP9_9PLEO|nr:P450 family sporulation-specific N-formyltyrosine oxidase Dit2 [Delitschia confertaspora ATCC 74209]
MAFISYFAGIIAVCATLLYQYIKIPSSLPKHIPSVPIYVSLLGLWSSMGQDEIYDRWLRRPLETHGAVKIWFAGRWNILVTSPSLITQIFRNESVYAKAGSQKKIPWSVIASLVGDNIINSHGEVWKLYTGIMKPGMQKGNFEVGPILRMSRRFVDLLLQTQEKDREKGVAVNPLIQRFAIAAMGESFLDIDFGCLENPGTRIEVLQTIIKRTIFKPLYFNFPALDKYPWLFRSRRSAFAIMQEFEDLLFNLVRNRPRKLERKEKRETVKPEDELVVHMLERALEDGRLTEKQYRDNLKIVFLTAHENTQQLLNSMFWQLGVDQDIQSKLRAEVLATGTTEPTEALLNSLPYLTSVIIELLRVYPPVSQLINRVSLVPSTLISPHGPNSNLNLPAGTWVGWNAPGVHSSPEVWGPTAREFIPERWGTTPEEIMGKFRKETVKGNFIAFNSHSRKCLGQGYALLEMKICLFELTRKVKWHVDPGYKLKLTSVSTCIRSFCWIYSNEEHL